MEIKTMLKQASDKYNLYWLKSWFFQSHMSTTDVSGVFSGY